MKFYDRDDTQKISKMKAKREHEHVEGVDTNKKYQFVPNQKWFLKSKIWRNEFYCSFHQRRNDIKEGNYILLSSKA